MKLHNVTKAQVRALRALDRGPLERKEGHLWGEDVPESRTFTTSETMRILCEQGLAVGYHDPYEHKVTITDAGRELVAALDQRSRKE